LQEKVRPGDRVDDASRFDQFACTSHGHVGANTVTWPPNQSTTR
jgi:hypothetical protein